MPSDEQVQLADITDITLLKALAYDRVCAVNMNNQELQAIEARMRELQTHPPIDLSDIPPPDDETKSLPPEPDVDLGEDISTP